MVSLPRCQMLFQLSRLSPGPRLAAWPGRFNSPNEESNSPVPSDKTLKRSSIADPLSFLRVEIVPLSPFYLRIALVDEKMANHNMDPEKFRGTMGDMALGTALHAAARDYKKVSKTCQLTRSIPQYVEPG